MERTVSRSERRRASWSWRCPKTASTRRGSRGRLRSSAWEAGGLLPRVRGTAGGVALEHAGRGVLRAAAHRARAARAQARADKACRRSSKAARARPSAGGRAAEAAARHSRARRLARVAAARRRRPSSRCSARWPCLPRFFAGRAKIRRAELVEVLAESSSRALPIVAIVNLLMGAILAFVGAVQFKAFGAGIYVANLVGIASVRELTPILTAIVLAGRTGASFAARIATMQGNEEVDALTALGVSAVEFLVVPRVVALGLLMPLLYVYGCAFALLGGMAVAMPVLDVSATAYVAQTQRGDRRAQFVIGASQGARLRRPRGAHRLPLRPARAAQRGRRRIGDHLGRRSRDHRRHRARCGIRRVRERAQGLNMISLEDVSVGYGRHPVQAGISARDRRGRDLRDRRRQRLGQEHPAQDDDRPDAAAKRPRGVRRARRHSACCSRTGRCGPP